MNDCYESNKLYTLTDAQKRIWINENIYPHSPLHNIGGICDFNQLINFRLLEEAINIFIKDNDALKIILVKSKFTVKQYVDDYCFSPVEYIDFSCHEKPESAFNEWVDYESRKPFQLHNSKLYYFAMFKISECSCGYYIKMHHMISDGWSFSLLSKDICDIYNQLQCKGNEYKSNNSYISYIDSEKKYLQSQRFIKDRSFWNNKIQEFRAKDNDSWLNTRGKRKTFVLNKETLASIKKIANTYSLNLNALFISIYIVYKYKMEGVDSCAIGIPVANRININEKNTFGMFTSTVPFIYNVNDTHTFIELIKDVKRKLFGSLKHQKYPFNYLINDISSPTDHIGNLFDLSINYYGTKHDSKLNEKYIEIKEFYNGHQIYPLQLNIKEWGNDNCISIDFDYKTSEYSETQIDSIYNNFIAIINQILSNPNLVISNIKINESYKTLAQNSLNISTYGLFKNQEQKTPNNVALIHGDKHLTYYDLHKKVIELSNYLVDKGLKNGDITVVLTKPSFETVIAILAIMRIGGIFLPLDTCLPSERVSFIIKDAKVKFLLTNQEVNKNINFAGEEINFNDETIYYNNINNYDDIVESNEPLYLIYTSGTTGNPKGVLVNNYNLVNYLTWAKDAYECNEYTTFPLFTSISFDLTLTSIFLPLICGGKIVIYNDDNNEFALYKILKDNKVNIIKITPSHMNLIKDYDNSHSSIKKIIAGGEDLKVSLSKAVYESFDKKIDIYNEYGPTEATIGCMIHTYEYNNDTQVSVPIGKAISNVDIYILDKKLNILSDGCIGEMYISGKSVAEGYYNDHEMTKKKFIANPFVAGERMYKTGDMAVKLSDGLIYYKGRKDNQVKISGYRIEINEIENCIEKVLGVEQAIVINYSKPDGSNNLCAYIAPLINVERIKESISKYLPKYMIPEHFITLKEFPLNAIGKIDKSRLPEPIDTGLDNKNIAENNYKDILIDILASVLEKEKINEDDNFFLIGGDSIKAIQTASKLNTLGFKLEVKDILLYPVIKEMSKYIQLKSGHSQDDYKLCQGYIKLLPIVKWFFSQESINRNKYCQSILLNLKTDIDISDINLIFNELIKHHDSLRINYDMKQELLFYNNSHLTDLSVVKHIKMDLLDSDTQEKTINNLFDICVDIENDLLFRTYLLDYAPAGRKLFIVAHHLIIDVVSWTIILDDFESLYNNLM
ncbi:MAG: amino acid adenylation domain-containing protein, partial [Firmicutes bacterium]|nr:amino acid adenylation domain-containing protein [Bacillota bacterium]